MKIALLQTPILNIGNGFIDKGALEILRASSEDMKIIETSLYNNRVYKTVDKNKKINILHRAFNRNHVLEIKNTFNTVNMLDIDLAVIPGCILDKHMISIIDHTVKRLNDSGVPIMLLGVGGGDYQKKNEIRVKKFLKEREIIGMITRDKKAYSLYAENVGFAKVGIDCAFFIDDWYSPPNATQNYDAWTFGKMDTPDIESPREVVRPDHEPFNHPYRSVLREVWKIIRKKITGNYVKKADLSGRKVHLFRSDSLKEYLFIYKNANSVHTDRIHASVPSILYNTPVKFYYDTPRASLFSHLNVSVPPSGFLKVDSEKISQKKAETKSHVSDILQKV